MNKTEQSYVSPRSLVQLFPDLLTEPTLQRWRTEGVGPPYSKLGPRRVAYDLGLVNAWLADRTVNSTAAARERQR